MTSTVHTKENLSYTGERLTKVANFVSYKPTENKNRLSNGV